MRQLVSRHLENFLALCEARNMHVAAANKGITQPALTKSLKTLEGELGIELFMRTSKGIEPTTAGDLLYRHARAVDQAARFAELELKHLVDRTQGRLRIGIGPGLAVSSFPRVLVEFQKEFPDVRVSVEVNLTNALVDQLVRDNLDIVASASPLFDLPEHFASTPLTEIGTAVICRSGHPLTKAGRVTAQMLGDYGCVAFMEDQELSSRTERSFGGEAGTFRVVTQTNSVSFMLSLVSITDHFSLIGSNIVDRALQFGLVVLPTGHPGWRREIKLMCRAAILRSRPIQTLLGIWRERLGQ